MVGNSPVSTAIDWYNIPIEEVFGKLACTKNGLTNEAVQERLGLFGPNKFNDHKGSIFLNILLLLRNPRLLLAIIAVVNGWAKHSLSPVLFWPIGMLLVFQLPFPRVRGDREMFFHYRVSLDMAPLSRRVMIAVRNVCICFVVVGMLVEILVMYPFQHCAFRRGISNLLVLLIGTIPLLFHATVTIAIIRGSDTLFGKGAILRRMALIKDIADIDVLCSDIRGTLTLNELTIDKNLIEVFHEGIDANTIVLLAARACKTENPDAIDAAIIGMLSHPKEAWIGIQEVPSQLSNEQIPVTYIDINGKLKQVCKGAPQQILNLAHNKKDIEGRVHAVTEKFSERGWHSLAVAYQEVTDAMKANSESKWNFIGVIPLFKTPRHDSAGVLSRILDLGISVKMIAGDQLKMVKEIGRCLGMGTNMYPVSSLLRLSKDNDLDSASSIDVLIDKADGFSDVGPEHKCEIVKRLQGRQHICAITGREGTDCSALMKANVSIAAANATDAARATSDIVLTEPGLNGFISAVLTCRKISHRIKEYFIYRVSTTVHVVLGFMLLALIWKIDFPPLLMLLIATINECLCLTYAKYRVKRSPIPDRWRLVEILKIGVVIGGYLATVTILLFWSVLETDVFQRAFGVASLAATVDGDYKKLKFAIYLQVSFSSQALIVITQSRNLSPPKSRKWSRVICEILSVSDIPLNVMCHTVLAVYYQDGESPTVEGIGWGWAGVIWLYNIISHILLVFGMKMFGYYGKPRVARSNCQSTGTSELKSLVTNLK